MDGSRRSLEREVQAGDPSALDGLIRRLARAEDLEALWSLHRRYSGRYDLAEALAETIRSTSSWAVDAQSSVFSFRNGQIDVVCLPQLIQSDGSTLIELGKFVVDYGQPLSEMIDAAEFSHEGSRYGPHPHPHKADIRGENFPFNQTGKHEVQLALLNTGQQRQEIWCLDALTARFGRTRADLAHLLAVARRYLDLQRRLWMAALGSCWEHPRRGAVVPVLDVCVLRWLSLICIDQQWIKGSWWSLVVS